MQIIAGHDALQPFVERAATLSANHLDLPGRLVQPLAALGPQQLGGADLARAVEHLGRTWAGALQCFAEDARTLVEILHEVDARYVDTEMTSTAAFVAATADVGPSVAVAREAMP